MRSKDQAAREAAEAIDTVLDQMPHPGAKPDPADVLVANVKLHAAERAGATAADIQAQQRRR